MFRALWGPFVSGSDINLSDNVLGNAVSEAESHIAFADTRFNGKNAEKNAKIIGSHSRIKTARLYFVRILYFAGEQYKYIVSLISDSLALFIPFCLSCRVARKRRCYDDKAKLRTE